MRVLHARNWGGGGGGGSGGFTRVDRVVQELTKGMERSTGLSGDTTLTGGTGGGEQLGGEKGERVHPGCELDYKKPSGGGGSASSGAVITGYMNLENGGEGAAAMEKEGRDPRGLNDVGLINNSPITTRAAISDAAALSKFNVVDEWGKYIDVELLNEEDSR